MYVDLSRIPLAKAMHDLSLGEREVFVSIIGTGTYGSLDVGTFPCGSPNYLTYVEDNYTLQVWFQQDDENGQYISESNLDWETGKVYEDQNP